MIEKTLYDYLKENMSVPVYMEYPKEEVDEFVVLEMTASSCESHLYETTIAIQSYSTTLFKTANLNREVIDVMFDCISIDKISKCELNSAYNYPDTQRKKYRYQAVFDLYHLK